MRAGQRRRAGYFVNWSTSRWLGTSLSVIKPKIVQASLSIFSRPQCPEYRGVSIYRSCYRNSRFQSLGACDLQSLANRFVRSFFHPCVDSVFLRFLITIERPRDPGSNISFVISFQSLIYIIGFCFLLRKEVHRMKENYTILSWNWNYLYRRFNWKDTLDTLDGIEMSIVNIEKWTLHAKHIFLADGNLKFPVDWWSRK